MGASPSCHSRSSVKSLLLVVLLVHHKSAAGALTSEDHASPDVVRFMLLASNDGVEWEQVGSSSSFLDSFGNVRHSNGLFPSPRDKKRNNLLQLRQKLRLGPVLARRFNHRPCPLLHRGGLCCGRSREEVPHQHMACTPPPILLSLSRPERDMLRHVK